MYFQPPPFPITTTPLLFSFPSLIAIYFFIYFSFLFFSADFGTAEVRRRREGG